MSKTDESTKNPVIFQEEKNGKAKVVLSANFESGLKVDIVNQNGTLLYNKDRITVRGWIVLLSLGITCFSAFSSYSLIAPFFWRVAKSKGLTFTEYTMVFCVYEVVKIFLPPICSKVALKMTPKVLLMTGMIIIAWCSTIFGLLIYAHDGTEFLILCMIVRVCWSVGGASASVCSNLLGTLLFPNHIPTVYCCCQIGAGLGLVSGPWAGGYLFEKGGFPLPFIITSIICLFSIIPLIFLVHNELRPKNKNKKEKSTSIWQALKIPGVTINMLISGVVSLTIGFNESSLDFHLQEIGQFSPSQVGQIFLITGLIYSIFTVIYSRLAENWPKAYYLIFLGLILISFSFIIVGPIHGLPLEPNVIYVILSQCSFGIAMAALYILSFDDCMSQAKLCLPDNDSSVAVINGLYTSSYSFGVAIGPGLAGQMIDNLGYRKSTVPITIMILALSVIVAFYTFKIRKNPRSKI